MTSARGLVRSRRASMARSVLPSWKSVSPSVTSTKPNSVRPSCKSPNTKYKVPAAKSSRNIGSRTVSRAMEKSVRRWPPGRALGPSVARRRAASAWLKPASAAAESFIAPHRAESHGFDLQCGKLSTTNAVANVTPRMDPSPRSAVAASGNSAASDAHARCGTAAFPTARAMSQPERPICRLLSSGRPAAFRSVSNPLG